MASDAGDGLGGAFSPPGLLASALVAGSVTAAVLLISSQHALRKNPSSVIALAVLLAAAVLLQQPIRDIEARLREDAMLDALTGLLNRHGLERRFAEIAVHARRLAMPVSLVLFDIDRFKTVNDTHGHVVGDGVTDILQRSLRYFELLHRLGGDELLLVLPGASSQETTQIAEEARQAVQDGHPAELEVTVSVGVCTATGERIALDEMYSSADRSLYAA